MQWCLSFLFLVRLILKVLLFTFSSKIIISKCLLCEANFKIKKEIIFTLNSVRTVNATSYLTQICSKFDSLLFSLSPF